MRERAPEADKHGRREIVGPTPWRCASLLKRWAPLDGSELWCITAMLLSLDKTAMGFRKHLHCEVKMLRQFVLRLLDYAGDNQRYCCRYSPRMD